MYLWRQRGKCGFQERRLRGGAFDGIMSSFAPFDGKIRSAGQNCRGPSAETISVLVEGRTQFGKNGRRFLRVIGGDSF